MTAVIVVAIVAVGYIVHAVATLVFALSSAGRTQVRGHELGLW